MIIEKTSILTGRKNVMDLPITETHYKLYLSSKQPITKVFPDLTDDEIEFLTTGITPEELMNHLGSLEDDVIF